MPLILVIGNDHNIHQKLVTRYLYNIYRDQFARSAIMYQSLRFEKSSSEALLPVLETQNSAQQRIRTPRKYLLLVAATISCLLIFASNTLPACLQKIGQVVPQEDHTTLHESTPSSRLDDFRTCSIKNFEATHFPFLDGVQPIARDEFVARRQRLAEALLSDGADAFAVEPGKLMIYAQHDAEDTIY